MPAAAKGTGPAEPPGASKRGRGWTLAGFVAVVALSFAGDALAEAMGPGAPAWVPWAFYGLLAILAGLLAWASWRQWRAGPPAPPKPAPAPKPAPYRPSAKALAVAAVVWAVLVAVLHAIDFLQTVPHVPPDTPLGLRLVYEGVVALVLVGGFWLAWRNWSAQHGQQQD